MDLRFGFSFGVFLGMLYFNGGYGYFVVDLMVEYKVVVVEEEEEENECNSVGSFYVKVNMEGVLIGRKIDFMFFNGYYELIRILDFMFNVFIFCKYM